MSDSESFLTRWSRLKRAQPTASPTSTAPSPTSPVAPASPAPPSPAVDLATLPPIESLGPGSDISAFLSQGVPPELTQAALRSAWLADPAVRDFVEIADNQWDFNTPEAIPGFGPLGLAQQAKHLVTRALSLADNTPPPLLSPESDNPPNQVVADPVWQAASTPAQIDPTSTATFVATNTPAADAADPPTPNRRLHGTALPK